jgi:hypothetical protein
MEPEYIEPSATTRRKARALVFAAVVVATLALLVLAPRFFAHVRSLPTCEQFRWLQGSLIALLAIMPVFGIWGAWLARSVLKHQQWPLPNAWLLRRTRIRRGFAAKACAYGLLVASGLAIAIPLLGWALLGRAGLLSQPPQCAQHAAIERTSPGGLRPLVWAAHVER